MNGCGWKMNFGLFSAMSCSFSLRSRFFYGHLSLWSQASGKHRGSYQARKEHLGVKLYRKGRLNWGHFCLVAGCVSTEACWSTSSNFIIVNISELTFSKGKLSRNCQSKNNDQIKTYMGVR